MVYFATALSIASLLQYWYLAMMRPYLQRRRESAGKKS
jgi:hypothetical protein